MGIPIKSSNPNGALGRPRNPTIDRAILRAALELFIEYGVAGASIEKIARRAGVGKTSIYRRWSSREALLAQAIEVARNATGYTVEVVDSTPPQDFVELLVEACDVLGRPEIRRLMARLVGSVPDCPMLMEVYWKTYYLPRRLAFVRGLRRVQAAGLLDQHSDPETLTDMLIGALMHRLLLTPPEENSAGELRRYLIRLLGQAGFDLPELRR